MPHFSVPSAIRQRTPQFSPVVLRIFLGAAALFVAHRALIAVCPAYSHALVRGYLGDFLALPICVPFFAESQTWLPCQTSRRQPACHRDTGVLATVFSMVRDLGSTGMASPYGRSLGCCGIRPGWSVSMAAQSTMGSGSRRRPILGRGTFACF